MLQQKCHSKSSQYFVYVILYTQHHQNQLVHTLECLKTTSTVLLENNGEKWKHQVLPSSVLSGKIKLQFKHQPKLHGFRHMVFTTAHIGEHI